MYASVMDPGSFVGSMKYVDIVIIVSFDVFLVLGIYLLRIERHVYGLMTKKAGGSSDDQSPSLLFRENTRVSSGTMSRMPRTSWDAFSWDEKMFIQRRQHLLNWVAADFGA